MFRLSNYILVVSNPDLTIASLLLRNRLRNSNDAVVRSWFETNILECSKEIYSCTLIFEGLFEVKLRIPNPQGASYR